MSLWAVLGFKVLLFSCRSYYLKLPSRKIILRSWNTSIYSRLTSKDPSIRSWNFYSARTNCPFQLETRFTRDWWNNTQGSAHGASYSARMDCLFWVSATAYLEFLTLTLRAYIYIDPQSFNFTSHSIKNMRMCLHTWSRCFPVFWGTSSNITTGFGAKMFYAVTALFSIWFIYIRLYLSLYSSFIIHHR